MAIQLTIATFGQMLADYLAGESTITLRLFQNSFSPSSSDTLLSFSEASFVGYSGTATSSWSTPTAFNPSQTNASAITFTSTADQTPQIIYGAYMEDSHGNAVGGELFASPITIQFNGDQIRVSPILTMGQC